jgi:hypothetical protein
MSGIADKIQSIKDTISTQAYTKPSQEKQEGLVKALWECQVALTYLRDTRGLIDSTIKHFKLGYDEIRHAVSIPVFKYGELINIRYRMIDPEKKPKYTQEKGCEIWVFNDGAFKEGTKKGRLILEEGEIDCMTTWQAGFKEVISPASGKDSYGTWIEKLDPIKRVIILYDNDKPGKTAALKLAERVGIDKCSEALYPEGCKDANEFFLTRDPKDFYNLLKDAKPYYKYAYQGVGDIITDLRQNTIATTTIELLPKIKWENDWVGILSGVTNVGKTAMGLNIASELARRDIPVIVMPFERGIRSVGSRFIQLHYDIPDFDKCSQEKWDSVVQEAVNLPLYFSVPTPDEFGDIVRRAKRLFDVQFCVIDHLDYFVRGSDRFAKQADMIEEIKTLAQETQIRFIVVHHLRKGDTKGGMKPKKPSLDDLKGSSDLAQIAEVVLLLYEMDDGNIEVIVDKNKGPMDSSYLLSNKTTGKMSLLNGYEPEEDAEQTFKDF